MSNLKLLTVADLTVSNAQCVVLSEISFVVKYKQHMVIAGETGSGKSTLLQSIAALVQPDQGTLLLEDTPIAGPADKLVPGHPEIAYLSQHFELPKSLRVEQVLDYANLLSKEEAATLFTLCQIDHLLTRKTNQLSGGERQRIALAKLLVTSPQLLLLDEPFSHLDAIHKSTLKAVIENVTNHYNITTILVSHDPSDTLPWAEKVLVLRAGRVVQEGTSAKIYKHPVNAYVAGLFGKYNVIPAGAVNVFAPKTKSRKDIFIRPEALVIEKTNKKGGCKAVVLANSFYGSHYDVTVQINEQVFVVRAEEEYEIAKKVFVRLR